MSISVKMFCILLVGFKTEKLFLLCLKLRNHLRREVGSLSIKGTQEQGEKACPQGIVSSAGVC